jgi:hypothetical protein
MIVVLYLIVAVIFKVAGVSSWWQELLLGIPIWGWGIVVTVAMSPSLGFASAVSQHLASIESRVEELEETRDNDDEDEADYNDLE